MYRKPPPVKLEFDRKWYNFLNATLSKISYEDKNAKSQKLIDKIKGYSKFYNENEGKYIEEYVDLHLFETEASDLIHLLLYQLSAYERPDRDYYQIYKELIKLSPTDNISSP